MSFESKTAQVSALFQVFTCAFFSLFLLVFTDFAAVVLHCFVTYDPGREYCEEFYLCNSY